MCAITLHFSGLQLVFDAGALQPSLQLPGCLATGYRCVLAMSMTCPVSNCLRRSLPFEA